MIRLFVDQPLAAGAAVALGADQARYLVQVMRRAVGDEVAVFNGADGEWRARIAEAGKRGCLLVAERLERPQAVGPDLELIVAVVKRGPLETIVEKAAELGARRVRLALTERVQADRAKLARLQAIAVEAAEQTVRMDVPQIVEPAKLEVILAGLDGRRLLFCDEAGDAPPVLEALTQILPRATGEGDPWAILIGPEGGFSPGERARLRAAPFALAASLGPRILRADTAAISAMTLWQAALGDWNDAARS